MTGLRMMTYNIHSCRGGDGQYLPERIARVIAACRADVVALQEVDVNRRRSQRLDQAHHIAHHLQMAHHFHTTVQVEEERYGIAILSRLPMEPVAAGPLPSRLEPRGVLWVQVTWRGEPWQVLNTHLGLTPAERQRQLRALLTQWLADPACRHRSVLCGDFNTHPRSGLCRRLRRHLCDASRQARQRHVHATFPSRLPLVRLDHIFVSPDVAVRRAEVRDTPLSRIASDHLPLVAELEGGESGILSPSRTDDHAA
ncbi:hypothetical protein MIT9_P2414 [Methylomarinovum caldicuralii]|uniref:Endonuclease/exonuclease/phosphatase domain-containing protein n=1 Tax=Methylomarinovum caldicuralii TaxID=438856 RepID=A0AAU9BVN7_9GAMM|nr:endonuclease/exonuclease/phosphatase family protein [Methylomarinovum caldicuralii]BCX82826.1 hypothetical protein MIT9_P2414 [Methylomarinovum caldicuralii]